MSATALNTFGVGLSPNGKTVLMKSWSSQVTPDHAKKTAVIGMYWNMAMSVSYIDLGEQCALVPSYIFAIITAALLTEAQVIEQKAGSILPIYFLYQSTPCDTQIDWKWHLCFVLAALTFKYAATTYIVMSPYTYTRDYSRTKFKQQGA